jgi:segregation and condensation protein B
MSEIEIKPQFEELARQWAENPDSADQLIDEPMDELLDASSDEDLQRLAQAIANQEEIAVSEVIAELPPQVDLEAEIAEDIRLQNEAEAERQAELEADALASKTELQLDADEMQSCIEALLFISDKALSQDRLRSLLGPQFEAQAFQTALDAIRARYQAVHHGIELVEVAGGYQFRTKPGRADLAKKLVRVQTQRLSSGSMETLAIVAYQQPVMKEEIDKIRGVDSSYFVRGLLDRKLIKISGRSELPGRPMLYGTTPEFLEVFGLKDLSSLPSLRELEQMIPQSQSGNPHEDDPKTREMRRLVSEMKADHSSALHYNPKEDEKILKEIRDQVNLIPTSTPYLDELKAAENLAIEQQKLALEQQNLVLEPPTQTPQPQINPD